jgi:hypothetical protein
VRKLFTFLASLATAEQKVWTGQKLSFLSGEMELFKAHLTRLRNMLWFLNGRLARQGEFKQGDHDLNLVTRPFSAKSPPASAAAILE